VPLSRGLALTALLLAPLAVAGTPVPVEPLAPGVEWSGQQYPGVDAKGRVFLLRGETLDVYPVRSNGSLGEPRRLQASRVDQPAPVLDAQMDPHGDWVLLHGAEVRWFRSGEEEIVPTVDWLVTAVELAHGRPLVAVAPFKFHQHSKLHQRPIPRLLTATGDDWSTLVESDLRTLPPPSLAASTAASGHLHVSADGEIWFAKLYGYQLTSFSPAGRQRLDVKVDGAEVRHHKNGDRQVEAAAEDLETARARTAHPERHAIEVQTAIQAILDLAEGRDGRIHLLVHNPDGPGLALDRLDPLEGVLERVVLSDAVAHGAMSLVAGNDGFYLVPFSGREDRYLVRWEALDQATWEPVERVEIDGRIAVAR